MKRVFTLPLIAALSACTAPEIADWPPTAPDVDEEIIKRYVDVYAATEPNVPVYGPDDINALNLLHRRKLRNSTPDNDIERLRDELDAIKSAATRDDDEGRSDTRSRNEINAIKRRAARKYKSKHDQRMELKRYGL